MSEHSPYEKLGITAEASFEEVQTARDRLLAESSGNAQEAELIEAAYDAVLMERLRLRQEGKIKVPEVIRFPERPSEVTPSLSISAIKGSPIWQDWLQNFRDTPDRKELLWSSGVFTGLGLLSCLLPNNLANPASSAGVLQLCLALGLGYSLYALNRKERRFGRACLLSIVGLLVGLILGSAVIAPVSLLLLSIGMTDQQAISLFTFFVLWLITSFLR